MPGVKQVFDAPTKWQAGRRIGIDVDNNGIRLWRPDMYGAFDSNLALVGKDGSSVAPLSGYVATLRPGEGRFGGAVAVEEGTTNLVYDSGTIFLGTHISPDELPAPPPVTPVFCYTWTDLNWRGDIELAKTFQAGDVVTISGWIYESGPWAKLSVYGTENGTGRSFGSAFEPTGQIGWHYFEKTVVFQGETTKFRIEDGGWDYHNPDRADESQIWLVNVQIEEKPFATSFVAGTRAEGRLMYPGVIPSNEGTLVIWVKKNTLEPNTRDGWRKILDAQLPRIDFQWNQHGDLTANFGGANLSIPDPAQDLDWHQYAITYSGRTVKMYFDGQLVASGQAQEDLVNFSELCVGVRWDGRGAGNALYDELLILPYAASEEEIRSWYEQDAPLKQAVRGVIELPPLDLSPVTEAAGSAVSWNALEPPATSAEVEIRLSTDGGQTWTDWQSVTNGGAIPGITSGANLANVMLQARVTLESTDADVTPTMDHLALRVPMAGHLSAPTRYAFGVRRAFAAPTRYDVGVVRSVNLPVRYEVGVERLRSIPFRVNVLTISRRFSPTRLIAAQLWIARPDGHAWEDVTEYLRMASWRLGDVANLGTGKEGVDERVRTAVFELQQDRPAENSLSPRDRASAWNLYQGEYAPLIWPRRHVVYRVAIGDPVSEEPNQHVTTRWAEWVATTDGESRTYRITPAPLFPERVRVYLNGVLLERGVDYTVDYDTGEVTFAEVPPAGLHITADYTYWRTAFEGYIDSWQVHGSSIEVVCRDLAARIQDAYIEEARTYGSSEGEPLEDVLQRMLDENLGEGLVTLHYTKPSGFMVTPYLVEYQTIWDALQNAVIKTVGWYLGYMYDRWQNRFTLQLIEPPRHKSVTDADWELDWRDDIYVDEVGGSITDVRNVCWVTYRDRESGKRQVVKYEDQASIQEYGRRAMQIEEADASYIDTYEEAYALARAAVEDLKDQHATVRLEIPFQPLMDVMDAMVVIDERISSTPDFFAVESIEQTMDFARGRYRTTIVGSGKVTGAHSRWLEMQTRPGAQQPVRMISADAVEVTQSRPPKPRDVRAYGVTGGIVVTVPEPPLMKNWRFTRVRVYEDGGELVVEDAARATRFQFLGLAAGARYHAEAQYEDNEGTTGDWSDRASAVASGEFTALALVVQESAGVGTDLTVGRDATIAGKASVGMLESQGAVSGTVVRATQYIQLPVLSADPPSPPNGAMWMRE